MQYKDTGLPDNPLFETAFEAGFKVATILNGRDESRAEKSYRAKTLAAVECLRDACPDVSDAAIAAVLLGPLSSLRLRNENAAIIDFGREVVEVLKARDDLLNDDGSDAYKDARRVFLAQSIVNMREDVHGLKVEDRFQEQRRFELGQLRDVFNAVKGHNPRLDAMFTAAMLKSEDVFRTLDGLKKAQPATVDPDKPKPREPETPDFPDYPETPLRPPYPKPPQC